MPNLSEITEASWLSSNAGRELTDEIREWALHLLRASANPVARGVSEVWLVEPGLICFTSGIESRPKRFRTAFLRHGSTGNLFVYEVREGWDLVDGWIPYWNPDVPEVSTTED